MYHIKIGSKPRERLASSSNSDIILRQGRACVPHANQSPSTRREPVLRQEMSYFVSSFPSFVWMDCVFSTYVSSSAVALTYLPPRLTIYPMQRHVCVTLTGCVYHQRLTQQATKPLSTLLPRQRSEKKQTRSTRPPPYPIPSHSQFLEYPCLYTSFPFSPPGGYQILSRQPTQH